MKKKSSKIEQISRRPDRDRRVRQNARIARVLRLLNLIRSGSRNAAGLAQELECSERTVYRDLEVLQFAGIPWFFNEKRQRYEVRPDFQFPTVNLTDNETIGLVIATKAATVEGLNITGGVVTTTEKLSANSAKKRKFIEDASRLIHVLDLQLADHSRHGETIATVQRALIHGRQLKGTYQSPYQESSVKLTLDGIRLCLIKQAWYLIAVEHGKNRIKTYRVTRFQSLRETDRPTEVPRDFDLNEFFGNAWAVYRGEKTFTIRLRFSEIGASLVTETKWHHTQKVQRHRDGSATLTFKVDGLSEIVYWILGWGDRVTVLDPPELRSLVAEKLQSALAEYSDAH